MLGKSVNWCMMTAHSHSYITVDTIDIPTDVHWNGGLMEHAITNGLLKQGWVVVVEIPRSPQVYTSMEDRTWDHHFIGGGQQYRDSWDPQSKEGRDQYGTWDNHNQGRTAQYMDVRSTWGGREGYIDEDRYPYAWKDAVDDTIHEEDFQDAHDKNNCVPQYPSFYGNVYNRTEHYPMSPLFCASVWDDERGLRIRTLGNDDNIWRGGGGHNSREINRDD